MVCFTRGKKLPIVNTTGEKLPRRGRPNSKDKTSFIKLLAKKMGVNMQGRQETVQRNVLQGIGIQLSRPVIRGLRLVLGNTFNLVAIQSQILCLHLWNRFFHKISL